MRQSCSWWYKFNQLFKGTARTRIWLFDPCSGQHTCGQLWQVWPSHLRFTGSTASIGNPGGLLWSSCVPPDRAGFHVMMPMSLAAGKWAPLTSMEVFSSCPAHDGAHSHAFRYSGKNGLTLHSENEWMQLSEGHHLVLMFTQKASGQLLREQT